MKAEIKDREREAVETAALLAWMAAYGVVHRTNPALGG
jgi:hypothetical protein